MGSTMGSKFVIAIIRFVKGHAVRSKCVLAIIRFVKGHAVRSKYTSDLIFNTPRPWGQPWGQPHRKTWYILTYLLYL